jgi:hypothetical protein
MSQTSVPSWRCNSMVYCSSPLPGFTTLMKGYQP